MVSLGRAVEEDKPSVLVVDDLRSNLESFKAIFLAVAMEAREPYTSGHSTRVGDISILVGHFITMMNNLGPEKIGKWLSLQ